MLENDRTEEKTAESGGSGCTNDQVIRISLEIWSGYIAVFLDPH